VNLIVKHQLPKSFSCFRFLDFAISNARVSLEIISSIFSLFNRQAFLAFSVLSRNFLNRLWDIWSVFEFVWFVTLGHLKSLQMSPTKFSPKLVFRTIGFASEKRLYTWTWSSNNLPNIYQWVFNRSEWNFGNWQKKAYIL